MKKMPMFLAMMVIITGQVGVSIYLPGLPMMSKSLDVSSAEVQTLVTIFLVGFGLSQLIYGPLSDAIGRKPVFIIGQSIYLLGTLLCIIFIHNIDVLIIGRIIQGLGAGSSSVLGRSILSDSYDGEQLVKALSLISVTASIVPIVAPILGGWLTFYLGWESIFLFVVIYLTAIFILGYFALPETLSQKKQVPHPYLMVKTYSKLLQNREVVTSASFNWINYLASVVSLSVMPFLLQHDLGLSAMQYGTVMIIPSVGLLLGGIALNVLNLYLDQKRLLFLSCVIILFSGFWLVISKFSTTNLIVSYTMLAIAQGIAFPLSLSMLLAKNKNQAGVISAFSGAVQMFLAGVVGAGIVKYLVHSQPALGVLYVLASTVMLFSLYSSRARQKTEQEFA